MNAMKNLLHAVILAGWVLMGAVFSLKCLFSGPIMAGFFTAGSWWLWFAGFAALTSLLVRRFEQPVASLMVHAAAFLIVLSIPKVFPLNLLSPGIDLLRAV